MIKYMASLWHPNFLKWLQSHQHTSEGSFVLIPHSCRRAGCWYVWVTNSGKPAWIRYGAEKSCSSWSTALSGGYSYIKEIQPFWPGDWLTLHLPRVCLTEFVAGLFWLPRQPACWELARAAVSSPEVEDALSEPCSPGQSRRKHIYGKALWASSLCRCGNL